MSEAKIKPAEVMNAKRHRHADLIHAWAEGQTIQINVYDDLWEDCARPDWSGDRYRVKPTPKPDVVRHVIASPDNFSWKPLHKIEGANLVLTYDADGKLKAAEVLS